jgi:hypothetical protein
VTDRYYSGYHDKRGEVGHYHVGTEQSQLELSEWYVSFLRRHYTMTQAFIGMLQSWNKFCFTTGYVEVSVSLPGSPQAPGLWPGM